MVTTRAWLSDGSVSSRLRLFNMLPSSWAVCSSKPLSHTAMSPAPTSVTVTVRPKIGTAISTAATHASITHAAYLTARLRMSVVLNGSKGAISLAHTPYYGLCPLSLLDISDLWRYLLAVVSLDAFPFPTLPH